MYRYLYTRVSVTRLTPCSHNDWLSDAAVEQSSTTVEELVPSSWRYTRLARAQTLLGLAWLCAGVAWLCAGVAWLCAGVPGCVLGYPGFVLGCPGSALGYPGSALMCPGSELGYPGSVLGCPGSALGYPGSVVAHLHGVPLTPEASVSPRPTAISATMRSGSPDSGCAVCSTKDSSGASSS